MENLRENNQEDINYIEELKNMSQVHFSVAIDCTKDGNEFEFRVCDLIIKGAAGSIGVYLVSLQITHNELSYMCIVLFGASILCGLTHQIFWSKMLLARANDEIRVGSRIYNLVYDHSKKLKDHVIDVLSESRDIFDKFEKKEKISNDKLKYNVWPKKLPIFLVYLQIVFILFGSLRAFGLTLEKFLMFACQIFSRF